MYSWPETALDILSTASWQPGTSTAVLTLPLPLATALDNSLHNTVSPPPPLPHVRTQPGVPRGPWQGGTSRQPWASIALALALAILHLQICQAADVVPCATRAGAARSSRTGIIDLATWRPATLRGPRCALLVINFAVCTWKEESAFSTMYCITVYPDPTVRQMPLPY